MYKPDTLLFEKPNEDIAFTVVEKSESPWLKEDIMLEVSVDNGCCETQCGCLTKDEVIKLQDYLKEYLEFLDNQQSKVDSSVPNKYRKYVKTPVIVDALQICDNPTAIKEFAGNQCDVYCLPAGNPRIYVNVRMRDGVKTVTEGDYIIKGVHGEIYPCKQDIFEEIYEEVPTEGGSDV